MASGLRWSRFLLLMVLLIALGGGACSSTETGKGTGSATEDGAPFVVDEPAPGQAVITGTKQKYRWHGGSPNDVVDVWFQPASGERVAIARGMVSPGEVETTVHLLAPEQRLGGTIVVERATPSVAHALRVRTHGSADGGAVKVGSLAAFAWNGATEDYFWIDVSTGERTNVGTVGDLESWTMKTLAVDHDAGRLAIVGFAKGLQQKLYVVDSKTGALVTQVAVPGETPYSGIQITKDHRVLAYAWKGDHEEMATIDPTTGAVTPLGTVGDLNVWQGQTAYDATSDTAYVFGAPAGGSGPPELTMYVMNTVTGALVRTVPVTLGGSPLFDVLGVMLSRGGKLLGMRWNGTREDVLAIDPVTGVATVVGSVGDLAEWRDGVAGMNATTGTAYVLGANAARKPKLYALDGETGALLYDLELSIPELPTQAALVY